MAGIYYKAKYLQKLVEVVVKALDYERCKIISDDGNNIKLRFVVIWVLYLHYDVYSYIYTVRSIIISYKLLTCQMCDLGMASAHPAPPIWPRPCRCTHVSEAGYYT